MCEQVQAAWLRRGLGQWLVYARVRRVEKSQCLPLGGASREVCVEAPEATRVAGWPAKSQYCVARPSGWTVSTGPCEVFSWLRSAHTCLEVA